jgi:pyruvate/2-oxoglutarate/acetoin dehydrogenase E1 component
MNYFDELCRAMELVAEYPRSIFMGQAVAVKGTAMTDTFKNVPREKLLELPVFEDAQLGMATGMALAGDLPVCIYPRFNFLLLAINQLVLHLDKLPLYSGFKPKVIIRTAIATPIPIDPGPQHLGDYSHAIRHMLSTVHVDRLWDPASVVPSYQRALDRNGSSLLIELTENYGMQ